MTREVDVDGSEDVGGGETCATCVQQSIKVETSGRSVDADSFNTSQRHGLQRQSCWPGRLLIGGDCAELWSLIG